MIENPEYAIRKRDFAEFLDPEHGQSDYPTRIINMLNNGKKRLIVDLSDLNQFNHDLRRNFLQQPMEYIVAWEEALNEYIAHANIDDKILSETEYKVGIEGNFGAQRLTPQQLRSSSIGTLVCVEGIVTKVSLVQPKVVQTVHYCETTHEFHVQNYRDVTSLTGIPTSAVYPITDNQGNHLTCEYGLSTYMNHQTIYIQDMPERTEPGNMPQSIECILEDDLVDACKPGDRVQMIGIYRALAGRAMGSISGRFRTVIIVNNVHRIGTDDNLRSLSVPDLKNIKKLSKRRDILSLLARSIAPSLYGHDFIKQAIVLQLLGGVEKNLDNGTHIRGDINILMVGDPSCGKSQLLRAVMNIAPLAINTTGRGSSGVGLTAAITMDRDTNERRLEAGAMVLADRGIVCIDEFDKMSDIDRTAIHEVMEQQTVTIAKAGIHTSLNARCSVIAAANPIYGQYDRSKKPHQNIALPDSLLSRFDLLFIVLDKIDTSIDRSISDHVLAMHLVLPRDDIDTDDFGYVHMTEYDDNQETHMIENNLPPAIQQRAKRKKIQYLTTTFCKKYIDFAKKQYKPVLTDSACELIAQKYGELRDAQRDQTLPITARCLETVIRLASAHAKIRLSKKITKDDVEKVMLILTYALTNDAAPTDSKAFHNKQDRSSMSDGESSNEDSDGNGPDSASQQVASRIMDSDDDKKVDELLHARKRKQREDRGSSPGDMASPARKRTYHSQKITRSMKIFVTQAISKLMRPDVDSVNISQVHDLIGRSSITDEQLREIIDVLHQENKIFVSEDTGNIYAI